MLSRRERRQLLSLLSEGEHTVEKSTVRRIRGAILQEVSITHSWMSQEHRLEVKLSTTNGDLLFGGNLASMFPEHDEVFFAALSDRAPGEERDHDWPRFVLVIENAVLPFLNSLTSLEDLRTREPDRFFGRGLVTIAFRRA